jgi:hypothetical protein
MTKEDIMKLIQDSYEQGQIDLMKSCEEAAVKAIELAIMTEREACAKLCQDTDDGTPYNLAEECAAAIRARSGITDSSCNV